MNAIVPFNFDGAELRVIDQSGEPWFTATDVCAILGISKHRDALSKLDADERGSLKVDTLGGTQDVAAVNESGLYTLILRCRDATTPGTAPHRFRKWVTSEVLPSIRRTGQYGATPAISPVSMSRLELLQLAIKSEEERLQLEHTVAELRPAATALARIATADGSFSITEAAKDLQIKPQELFRWLKAHSWIYRRPGAPADLGFQDKITTGYLEHKITPVSRSDGSEKYVTQVRVTPKGLARLAKEFGRGEIHEVG